MVSHKVFDVLDLTGHVVLAGAAVDLPFVDAVLQFQRFV